MVSALRKAGLVVTCEPASGDLVKVLGWHIEGGAGTLRPTRERLWRARYCIRALLQRGRASGRDLEKLLGHLTFMSLVRREVLAIFSSNLEVFSFFFKRKRAAVNSLRSTSPSISAICKNDIWLSAS